MTTRRTLPAVIAFAFALFFFGLGNYLGARQNADSNDAQFAALRAELSEIRDREPLIATGTTGRVTRIGRARRRSHRRRRQAPAER